MTRHTGIGLMSGTSLDGVDLACCTYSEDAGGQWTFDVLASETIPYDEQWYARLRCLDAQDAEAYAKTHVYLGHHLGRMLSGFIRRHGLRPEFAASHGQTIFHQPQRNFTAQIGCGETMVSYLPCPLVTNFRPKDVALGGQGAPLVPFGEAKLFPADRLYLNLGGIANLSAGSLAWDVCACNMALNWAARAADPALTHDPDGEIARSGQLDPALFAALEGLPYFDEKPPKSLGAEWFQQAMLPLFGDLQVAPPDLLHTLVAHVASRIAADVAALPARPAVLIPTGGGTHNAYLLSRIREALAPLGVRVEAPEAAIIDYKEAIIFGFLGLQTLLGRPNVLASVTGARLDVCGGSIHLPPGGHFRSLLGPAGED